MKIALFLVLTQIIAVALALNSRFGNTRARCVRPLHAGTIGGSSKPNRNGFINDLIHTGISTMFGSKDQTFKKRVHKQQLNNVIDKVFEGGGLTGNLVGGLMKGVGGVVVEMLVFDMMAGSTGDVGSIQESITTYLAANAATLHYLGSSLHFGTPFRATSCVSFNGVKTLSFAMSVRGNKDAGTVRVQATVKGATVTITELVFQGSNGSTVNVRRAPGTRPSGYIDVKAV